MTYLFISVFRFLCLHIFSSNKKAIKGLFSKIDSWKEKEVLEIRHACQRTSLSCCSAACREVAAERSSEVLPDLG